MPVNEQTIPERAILLIQNGPDQALQLPEEFRFDSHEIYIRKEAGEVILSARPRPRLRTWAEYLEHGAVASPEFMENVEDLPLQERDFF